ncbi:hypothetical protein C8J56DRAFT_407636 [Mycena floridula]|nr:hypothetical protein C8J56DRAFT_407636 [Mycena floridula]
MSAFMEIPRQTWQENHHRFEDSRPWSDFELYSEPTNRHSSLWPTTGDFLHLDEDVSQRFVDPRYPASDSPLLPPQSFGNPESFDLDDAVSPNESLPTFYHNGQLMTDRELHSFPAFFPTDLPSFVQHGAASYQPSSLPFPLSGQYSVNARDRVNEWHNDQTFGHFFESGQGSSSASHETDHVDTASDRSSSPEFDVSSLFEGDFGTLIAAQVNSEMISMLEGGKSKRKSRLIASSVRQSKVDGNTVNQASYMR